MCVQLAADGRSCQVLPLVATGHRRFAFYSLDLLHSCELRMPFPIVLFWTMFQRDVFGVPAAVVHRYEPARLDLAREAPRKGGDYYAESVDFERFKYTIPFPPL